MDNRVFDVNGVGSKSLQQALNMVFDQWSDNCTAKAWEHTEKGMILVWCKDQAANNLPAPMTADQVLPLVEAYLDSEDADSLELPRWSNNFGDSDVSCEKGWRVYVEDWGHVNNNHYAICAIIPSWAWYGK